MLFIIDDYFNFNNYFFIYLLVKCAQTSMYFYLNDFNSGKADSVLPVLLVPHYNSCLLLVWCSSPELFRPLQHATRTDCSYSVAPPLLYFI